MLPEFLSTAQWLAVFEEYGYARNFGDVEEEYAGLIATGKSPYGPPFLEFAATDAAELEVLFVVEFLVVKHDLNEDALMDAIRLVVERGW